MEGGNKLFYSLELWAGLEELKELEKLEELFHKVNSSFPGKELTGTLFRAFLICLLVSGPPSRGI